VAFIDSGWGSWTDTNSQSSGPGSVLGSPHPEIESVRFERIGDHEAIGQPWQRTCVTVLNAGAPIVIQSRPNKRGRRPLYASRDLRDGTVSVPQAVSRPMAMARIEVPDGAEHPRDHRADLDRMAVEEALIVARRRADACSPGGPSWDAAMGLVDDLERAIRQIDEPGEPTQIGSWIGAAPSG
jgi:hypothetical protein